MGASTKGAAQGGAIGVVGGPIGTAAGAAFGAGRPGQTGGIFDTLSDPIDIFGKRADAQAKIDAEEARRTQDRFGSEIDQLFGGDLLPGDIAQADTIDALQISDQLRGGQQTAGTDVDFLRNFAQSEGLSAQGQSLVGEQQLQESGLLDQLRGAQSTQGAQAFSNLASQGGAGAGARERLGSQISSQGLREAQSARREGALSRLGISSEDERRKLQAAGALPGLQTGVNAEQRAGLQADQGALLQAGIANQATQLAQNRANLQTQQDLFGAKAALLGGKFVSGQQIDQAAKPQGLFSGLGF